MSALASDRRTYNSKTPHFFKIILPDSIRDGKLGIPTKFISKYENNLSSSVQLKVPSRQIWQVELTEIDGVVYLDKGWKDFADYYSVEYGHFLVFRYEGNSHFDVVIFDKSATEIQYRFDANLAEEEIQRTQMEEAEDDASLEIADNNSRRKRAEKRPLDVRPHKKTKTTPAKGRETVSSLPDEAIQDPDHRMLDKRTKRSGVEESGLKEGGSMSKAPAKESVGADEKIRVLKRASTFKSKRPYFAKAMQPSYICRRAAALAIPKSFGKKYFTEEQGDSVLEGADGRCWPVTYRCGVSFYTFCYGWDVFARDNNLEVGDVCVFELIKEPKISFHVVIFRVNEDSNCACTSARCEEEVQEVETDGSLQSQKRRKKVPPIHIQHCKRKKRIPTTAPDGASNVQKGTPKFRHEGNQANRDMKLYEESLRIRGGKIVSVPLKARTKRWSLTRAQKAIALRRASTFRSRNPFFKMVMQPTYVQKRADLSIPIGFAEKYIGVENKDVTLQVSDGRSWLVKGCCSYMGGVMKYKLRAGLKAFLEDNNFKVGDVCVFELINPDEIAFRVLVFPDPDAACCHPPAGCECEAHRAKTIGDLTTNAKSQNKAKMSSSQLPQKSIKTEPSERKPLVVKDSGRRPIKRRLSIFGESESGYPFFKIVVKPHYLRKGHMVLPRRFCTKFIKTRPENVVLLVEKKRWPVKLISGKDGKWGLSAGFIAFMRANALQTGDTCVFEMVKKDATMFKVCISR